MTKVLYFTKQPFRQSQWHNWTTAVGKEEDERNIFSWFFHYRKCNVKSYPEGNLTQELYITVECSNQRTSDERVSWILAFVKKCDLFFFCFQKERGLAPAFCRRIWILNPRKREKCLPKSSSMGAFIVYSCTSFFFFSFNLAEYCKFSLRSSDRSTCMYINHCCY